MKNDYLKLKGELQHANPYRLKGQFASKNNYDLLIGAFAPQGEQIKTKIKDNKNLEKERLDKINKTLTKLNMVPLKEVKNLSLGTMTEADFKDGIKNIKLGQKYKPDSEVQKKKIKNGIVIAGKVLTGTIATGGIVAGLASFAFLASLGASFAGFINRS